MVFVKELKWATIYVSFDRLFKAFLVTSKRYFTLPIFTFMDRDIWWFVTEFVATPWGVKPNFELTIPKTQNKDTIHSSWKAIPPPGVPQHLFNKRPTFQVVLVKTFILIFILSYFQLQCFQQPRCNSNSTLFISCLQVSSAPNWVNGTPGLKLSMDSRRRSQLCTEEARCVWHYITRVLERLLFK